MSPRDATVERLAGGCGDGDRKMNSSEMEKGQEIGFHCESCNRMTDDFYILRDGSNLCVNCVELWEYDKAKQN